MSYFRQWIEDNMISPQYCEGGPDAEFVPICPEGWVDQFGKCYKVFTEPKTWQEAEDTCNINQVSDEIIKYHLFQMSL